MGFVHKDVALLEMMSACSALISIREESSGDLDHEPLGSRMQRINVVRLREAASRRDSSRSPAAGSKMQRINVVRLREAASRRDSSCTLAIGPLTRATRGLGHGRGRVEASTRSSPSVVPLAPSASVPVIISPEQHSLESEESPWRELTRWKRAAVHPPSQDEPRSSRQRVDQHPESDGEGLNIPPFRWGLDIEQIRNFPMPSSSSNSIIANNRYALDFSKAFVPLSDRQYFLGCGIVDNLENTQIAATRLMARVTALSDYFAHYEQATRNAVEAANQERDEVVRAKVAFEENQRKVEGEKSYAVDERNAIRAQLLLLGEEHERVISALRLELQTQVDTEQFKCTVLERKVAELEGQLVGQSQHIKQVVAETMERAQESLASDAHYYGVVYRRSALYMIKQRYPDLDLDGINFDLLEGVDEDEDVAAPTIHEAVSVATVDEKPAAITLVDEGTSSQRLDDGVAVDQPVVIDDGGEGNVGAGC